MIWICVLTMGNQENLDRLMGFAFHYDVGRWGAGILVRNQSETDVVLPAMSPPMHKRSLLIQGENLGVAGGRKWMVEHLRGECRDTPWEPHIFIFLDDDCVPRHPGWLGALVLPIQRGHAEATGVEAMTVTSDFYTAPAPLPHKMDHLTDYLSGGWCAIHTQVFDRMTWDTQFHPCYWEDVDLGLRMKREGFRMKQVDAAIQHDHMGRGNPQWFEENRQRFIQKWGSSWRG
jgi:GT2 family glycosyltransferase